MSLAGWWPCYLFLLLYIYLNLPKLIFVKDILHYTIDNVSTQCAWYPILAISNDFARESERETERETERERPRESCFKRAHQNLAIDYVQYRQNIHSLTLGFSTSIDLKLVNLEKDYCKKKLKQWLVWLPMQKPSCKCSRPTIKGPGRDR